MQLPSANAYYRWKVDSCPSHCHRRSAPLFACLIVSITQIADKRNFFVLDSREAPFSELAAGDARVLRAESIDPKAALSTERQERSSYLRGMKLLLQSEAATTTTKTAVSQLSGGLSLR